MKLFNIANPEEDVFGISCIQLTVDNLLDILKFFKNIKISDVSCYSMLPSLFHSKHYYYNVVDGYLCIYYLTDKYKELLLPPLNEEGKFMPVSKYAKMMQEKGLGRICYVSNLYVEKHDKLDKYFKKYSSGTGTEYIYDNFLLRDMKGKEFKNLRSKYNKFRNKNYPIRIVAYDDTMFDDAMKVYNKWRDTLGKKYERIWDAKYYEVSLKNYKYLRHNIWVIYDDKIPVGVVSFMYVNDNLVYGVHRKIVSDYQYLSEYMQCFMANELCNMNIRYINDGDDGNSDGLRQLKLGFKPICTFKACNLQLRDMPLSKKGDELE
jgi:hypothetical protein